MLGTEPLPSAQPEETQNSTISPMAGALPTLTAPPDSLLWQIAFTPFTDKDIEAQRQKICLRAASGLTSLDAAHLQASLSLCHLNLQEVGPELEMT